MRLVAALLSFALIASTAFAEDTNIKFDKRSGRPIAIMRTDRPAASVAAPLPPAKAAELFLNKYGKGFGLADPKNELLILKQASDKDGRAHVRYNQTVHGLPVFGAQVIVHVDKNGFAYLANGEILPKLSVDVNNSLTKDDAVAKAQEIFSTRFSRSAPAPRSAELLVYSGELLNANHSAMPKLVWRIELAQQRPAIREHYFIDAHSGEFVHRIDGINHLSREVHDCSWGGGSCPVDQYDIYSGYIFGRSEGQPARGANPYKLPFSHAYDSDVAYDAVGASHFYFASKFGRNGANGAGGIGDDYYAPAAATQIYTFIDDYDDSSCPNAWFDGFSVNFCQGLVFYDIVAHEYMHGVTQYSVLDANRNPWGLTYEGESGALNEAFSDIFGVAIENFAGVSSEWIIGEAIPHIVIRSLRDPAEYSYDYGKPYPNRFYSPSFYCGLEDEGGVHLNSGVPAHAAYLMAMGGTFNGCTVSPIGRDAQERIWYRALTNYLTMSANFNAAYYALIWSCGDLYGAGSDICWQVEKALKAVEMNQGGACSLIPAAAPDCGSPDSIPQPQPRLGAARAPSVKVSSKRATITMQQGGTIWEVQLVKGATVTTKFSRSRSYRTAKLKKGNYTVRYRIHTQTASPATEFSNWKSFRVK